MVPGLIAVLGLLLPLLIVLVALGLALALLSAPFVAIWALVRRVA